MFLDRMGATVILLETLDRIKQIIGDWIPLTNSPGLILHAAVAGTERFTQCIETQYYFCYRTHCAVSRCRELVDSSARRCHNCPKILVGKGRQMRGHTEVEYQ